MAVVIAIAILVAAVLFLRRQADEPDVDFDGIADATPEEQLLQLCLGDKAQAERLIELEIKRAPRLSRSQAVARAVRALRWARR